MFRLLSARGARHKARNPAESGLQMSGAPAKRDINFTRFTPKIEHAEALRKIVDNRFPFFTVTSKFYPEVLNEYVLLSG